MARATTADKPAPSTAVTDGHGWRHGLRVFIVGLLVALGCLAFGVYVVVHWAERQVLNTDNWVALVSPLPSQSVVSNALGSYISDQVFSVVAVQRKIEDALPPKAAFLAGPLTGQLQSLTTRAAQKLVASDPFHTIWEGANRIAMNRLLAEARGQTPPLQAKVNEKFNINLSDAPSQLRSALGSVSNAIPALQPASTKAVAISTDLRSRPHRLREYVRAIDTLAATLPLAIVAAVLGALALSRRRRHTAQVITIVVVVVMLLELIGIKWLHQEVLNQVRNPANLAAVGYIYDSLVGWLRHMIYVVLAAMVILFGLLLVFGPARWAVNARSYVHTERWRESRLGSGWRALRLWFKRYEYYLWLAVVVVVLVSMALIDVLTGQVALNGALLALGLVALVHIVATPPLPAGT